MRQRIQQAFQNYKRPLSTFRSDFDLNPDKQLFVEDKLRPAAVLVPIVERPQGATILLTRRSAKLAHHAGQISFPGGKIDAHDKSAVAAALRETREETGIDQQYIEIQGELDHYRTVTYFEVTPIVGLVRPEFQLCPEPGEVDEIFEVPLSFILNRANHRRESAEWGGQKRYYYAMPYGDYYIWGATAAMLVNLVDVLEPVMAPVP